jgi:hypothetical protein
MRESNRIQLLSWESDFKRLTELVNKWDPIGLIRCGAPYDEYDCLVSQILSKLYRTISVPELEEFLMRELAEHFAYSTLGPNEKLKSFCIMANVWFLNESCKMNELNLVKKIIENDIKLVGDFIKPDKAYKFKFITVERIHVSVNTSGNVNDPYLMWVVMQENMNPNIGKVVVYSVKDDFWGVAEYGKENIYHLDMAYESLSELLRCLRNEQY